MKTTILGGILFLVPVAVIAIILGKAYEVALLVAEPIGRIVPLETVAGVAIANLLAIFLILALCFAAGLAAKGGLFSKQIGMLDSLLIEMIPGYAVIKGTIGGLTDEGDLATTMVPVLVRMDDFEQIAFEIERDETRVIVFLPGAPSVWSGTAVAFTVDRVRPLNMSLHQTVKLLRVLGRGSLNVRRQLDRGDV